MHSNHWQIVETSRSNSGTIASLFRRSRFGSNLYKIVSNDLPDGEYNTNLYYSSDQAFNALEAWEVRNGILPKDYNPENY